MRPLIIIATDWTIESDTHALEIKLPIAVRSFFVFQMLSLLNSDQVHKFSEFPIENLWPISAMNLQFAHTKML